MMTRPPPDTDLHAYADGQLSPARQQELEAWLSKHPGAAAKVAAWRQQTALLHTAFDGILQEPLPQDLEQTSHPHNASRLRLPQPSLWRAVAVVAWLGIGITLGWLGRGMEPQPGPGTLAHRAAVAHAVYLPEVRHPVEVGADQENHLVQWLSKRLETPLKVPHFGDQGFELVGGRLLPGENGAVAQFMFQDSRGRRLTLYVAKPGDNRNTAFHYAQEGGIGVFYWLDGALAYALSGELPRGELLRLAESAYRQFSP